MDRAELTVYLYVATAPVLVCTDLHHVSRSFPPLSTIPGISWLAKLIMLTRLMMCSSMMQQDTAYGNSEEAATNNHRPPRMSQWPGSISRCGLPCHLSPCQVRSGLRHPQASDVIGIESLRQFLKGWQRCRFTYNNL